MNIRSASPEDKPAIIQLLKKSLGESAIPKSEALWTWKHEKNPFGSSFVLLAQQDGELIGLRAFMQWKWKNETKEWKAVRAVDTATHPAHQGKGIFKKLTLQQVEMCKQQGIDFVFNTPNEQSRPGYLMMGWQQQGRMPLKICVKNPLALVTKKLLKTNLKEVELSAVDWMRAEGLFRQQKVLKPAGVHTPMSYKYIDWRYATNPLFTYGYVSDFKNYLLVYRLKAHDHFNELRLTDFILFNHDAAVGKDLKQQIQKVIETTHCNLISFSGNQFNYFQKYFKWLGFIPVLKKGPIVTLRPVSNEEDLPFLMDEKNWLYSLGDMELF